MNRIVGKFFQHYKDNYYYVRSTSLHTETLEELVNYHSLYSTDKYSFGQMWSRPLNMWNETVNNTPRFIEVGTKEVPFDIYKKTIEMLNK